MGIRVIKVHRADKQADAAYTCMCVSDYCLQQTIAKAPASNCILKQNASKLEAAHRLPAVVQPRTADAGCTSRRPVLARRAGFRGCRAWSGDGC
jgi:hypothetical protein